ncbi:MAG: proton-conducting transporter membrane subunit [Candidatus Bathyarchaeota archaeon]
MVSSLLPFITLLVPFVFAVAVSGIGLFSRKFQDGIALGGIILTLILIMLMIPPILAGDVLVYEPLGIFFDGMGLLMAILIGILGVVAITYSVGYMPHEVLRANLAPKKLTLYYPFLLTFIGALLGITFTNNILVLWVILEAATPISAILIFFLWQPHSLEAGYKYIILISVGMVFSLLGVFIVFDLTGQLGLLAIANVIPKLEIPPITLKLMTAFFIIGFGVKAGLVPFHAWLPDAHSTAPSPISALISGILVAMGIYALVRVIYVIYVPLGGWEIGPFLTAFGALSMIAGILLALAQDDLKRMIAYSTISCMGYVILGLGLGTSSGILGGLFYLVSHALFKALLFLCAGAVIYRVGTRKISEMGGLFRSMPVTAVLFLIGTFSIAGFPPFNGFVSKLIIYFAVIDAGYPVLAIIAIIVSVLTAATFLRAAHGIFFGEIPKRLTNPTNIKEAPLVLLGPMIVLAALCILFGIQPEILTGLLKLSANSLLGLVGG